MNDAMLPNKSLPPTQIVGASTSIAPRSRAIFFTNGTQIGLVAD